MPHELIDCAMKILASVEDWEIVDDDGFIYKRRRREAPAGVVQEQQPEIEEEPLDVAEIQRESLQKRKEMLLKNKQIYAAELRRWEELFSKQEELTTSVNPPSLPLTSMDSPAILLQEPHYEPYEELLHQVQELEWFIKKHTSFCDKAEDMCLMLDEELKYDKLQLPSPRQIFQETTDV